MRTGKLYPHEIKKILGGLTHKRKEVLLSGTVGEDCAVIHCPDYLLVTSDPITWKTNKLGALSIHISANDIYASGGEPFAASITLIATPDTAVETIEQIMTDAENTARSLGIDIVGGHTEWSDSVSRTITSVTMLGRTEKPIYTTSAKSGDLLVMTKYAGLEGTAILAGSEKNKLTAKMTAEELDFAESLMDSISVRKEAEVLREFNISAMHDITEGGVLGAAAEMCGGKESINTAAIPVLDVTKKLCDALGLDPFTLIGSGSMLFAASVENVETIIKKLAEAGINAVIIGEILSK